MSIIAPIQGFPSGSGGGGASVPVYFVTQNTNLSTILQKLSSVNAITIMDGVTLTVDQNITLPSNISLINGNGILLIADGMTLTLNSNLNLAVNYLDGGVNTGGTLQVNSGYTLTIVSKVNLGTSSSSIISINGSGTLQIATLGILTQNTGITLGISTINIYGTYSGAYQITIPSGVTQVWYVYGSVTGSPTLLPNGTVYWFGNGITGVNATSDALPTLTWKVSSAVTGIFIGSPYIYTNQTLATNPITLSNTSIAIGSDDGSNTGTGNICYFTFTSIQGSIHGKYGLGFHDTTTGYYMIFLYIVLGTTSAYTINSSFKFLAQSDATGDTVYVHNSASSGSLTLNGTAYV
ncbi:MAG: hypothetical protein RXO36_05030 [Candidatus Nanopusillus acidilobi]